MGYTMNIESWNLEAKDLTELPAVEYWADDWVITEEGRIKPVNYYFKWDDSFEDFLTALAKAGVTGELELSGEQAEWYKYVLKDGVVECYEGSVVYSEEPQSVLER